MNNFFLEASYKGLLSTEAGDSIKADGLNIFYSAGSILPISIYKSDSVLSKKIFDNTIKDDTLSLSKSICHNALFDSSFEMSNYQNIHASEELQPEFSLIAIKNLLD
jgi:hypothetical protein